MKTKNILSISVIGIIGLIGIIVFLLWQKDPCINLESCEQYKCLNPQFYCSQTLYESNIQPTSFKEAQQIVMDYIHNKLGLTAEITSSWKVRDPYQWYQITCNLSDGSEYGFEVGPDGNIYEIKHLN